jgi:hypothetical protein
MKELAFDKEKISSYAKISKELIDSYNVNLSHNDIDFVMEELTLKIDAYIYANTSETITEFYEFKRPTFFEWLFRKKRYAEFTIQIKDILINPPKMPKETVRIYKVINSEN